MKEMDTHQVLKGLSLFSGLCKSDKSSNINKIAQERTSTFDLRDSPLGIESLNNSHHRSRERSPPPKPKGKYTKRAQKPEAKIISNNNNNPGIYSGNPGVSGTDDDDSNILNMKLKRSQKHQNEDMMMLNLEGKMNTEMLELYKKNHADIFNDRQNILISSSAACSVFENDIVKEKGIKLANGVSSADFDNSLYTMETRIFDTISRMSKKVEAGNKKPTSTIGAGQNYLINLSNIEAVPRKYEDRYLYEPTGNERNCAYGTQCVSYIKYKFILKEFLTPKEEMIRKQDNSPLNYHNACLLCCRMETVRQFISRQVQRRDIDSSNEITQSHMNFVNVKDEYNVTDTLHSSKAILYPQVIPFGDAFTVSQANGVKFLIQSGYEPYTPPLSSGPEISIKSNGIITRNTNGQRFPLESVRRGREETDERED